jgi:WD40 repeat protein
MLWEVESALDDSEGSYDGITLATQLEDSVEAVVFDASDTLLVLCLGFDLLILEVNTGGQYCRLEGHTAKVTGAVFSVQSPHLLISISEDRTFKIWDLASQSLFYQSAILSASPFLSVAADPLRNRFAVGSNCGRVWVYEMKDRGCREVRCLELRPLALQEERRQRQAQVQAEVDSVPRVISSLPSWAASEGAQASTKAAHRLKRVGEVHFCVAYLSITTLIPPSYHPHTTISYTTIFRAILSNHPFAQNTTAL